MKIATVTLRGVSPYQQGRYHQIPKEDKESHDDYKRRTWRDQCHLDDQQRIVIPPMALKNAVADAAKYLSIPIQGKGTAKYTKHFLSGILVLQPAPTNKVLDEVVMLGVFGSSTGQRGSSNGKRVMVYLPTLLDWTAEAEFTLLDDIIPKDVFERVLREAGQFIGIGVFRPQNGGYYGRFAVDSVKWTER